HRRRRRPADVPQRLVRDGGDRGSQQRRHHRCLRPARLPGLLVPRQRRRPLPIGSDWGSAADEDKGGRRKAGRPFCFTGGSSPNPQSAIATPYPCISCSSAASPFTSRDAISFAARAGGTSRFVSAVSTLFHSFFAFASLSHRY